MNDDLISRAAAIDAISSMFAPTPTQKDMVEDCLEIIENLPSAEPEHMHTVMLKIKEKYEKAMNTPCINNPIAWALYQTWKEYDR